MFGRYFEAFQASDVRPLLKEKISANELAKWPLFHGSVQLGYDEKRAEIQASGLRASAENINSDDADRLLGRTEYVFIGLATFRMNYGFGGSGVLIDPAVLTTKGIICSEQDIAPAIKCVEMALDGKAKYYCGTAEDAEKLITLAEAFVHKSGRGSSDALTAFLQTDSFAEYYSTHHKLSVDELLERVERNAGHKMLFELFNRTGLWRDPEIMVPKEIPCRQILGYVDGFRFTKWHDPESPDVQTRLDAWIETLGAVRQSAIPAVPEKS